ncbi:MAG: hypothetical protein ABSD31_18375 [Candidatus Binataceae bacterium]|jgi:hypothetical protein
MGSQEVTSNPVDDDESAEHAEQKNDELASKLSKELSNWRRRRTSARPRPADAFSGNGKARSEPARTIKVRGHETLVIRKPKAVIKPSSDSAPDKTN